MMARELAHSGQRSTVLILSREMNPRWRQLPDSCRIVSLGGSSEALGMLRATWWVYTLSRQARLDTVFSSHTHVNAWLSCLRGMDILRCRQLVCRESTNIPQRFSGLRLGFFALQYLVGYGYQDRIVCQTPEMLLSIQRFLQPAQGWPMESQPNPIDVEFCRNRAIAPEAPSLPPGPPAIVAVGRLIPDKDFQLLIRSFALHLRRFPERQLVIVGSGQCLLELRELAEGLCLSSRVSFLGHLDNPHRIMRTAHICVVSSLREGFPNVLLEMMALCDRVVTTLCAGGVADLAGVVHCRNHRVETLADCLARAEEIAPDTFRATLDLELSRRSPRAYLSAIFRT